MLVDKQGILHRLDDDEVIIPDGVITIGSTAFKGCSKRIYISVPSSVTSIEYGAFSECSGLWIYYSGTMAMWKDLHVKTDNIIVICDDGVLGVDVFLADS